MSIEFLIVLEVVVWVCIEVDCFLKNHERALLDWFLGGRNER